MDLSAAMASQSPPFSSPTSTEIPISQMIESLSQLQKNLSIALQNHAGDQIEEERQNPKFDKLLSNIQHLKETLGMTKELDKKLNEPIQSN
ncbi:unnamed protein product [Citrullus colocynthis]|uniref:Uncharacterized protein n=1 Tax=Citrullus colocynthis TaxID=252529 RepID=A0ABP0XSJ8_9ROSI